MTNWKQYSIAALVVLALLYAAFLIGQWKRDNQGAVLPAGEPVAEHDVKTAVPVKAKDKKELEERGEIPKSVAADDTKEVTATGTKTDSDGTTHVAAVLDTTTGKSVIVEERPLAEVMRSNAAGIGIGVNREGIFKDLYYQRTFGRFGDLYLLGRIDLLFFEAGKTGYQAEAILEYRW